MNSGEWQTIGKRGMTSHWGMTDHCETVKGNNRQWELVDNG